MMLLSAICCLILSSVSIISPCWDQAYVYERAHYDLPGSYLRNDMIIPKYIPFFQILFFSLLLFRSMMTLKKRFPINLLYSSFQNASAKNQVVQNIVFWRNLRYKTVFVIFCIAVQYYTTFLLILLNPHPLKDQILFWVIETALR